MKKSLITLTIVALVLFVLPDIVGACPNCKESYMDGGQSPVSSGFNASIVFMMLMPFFVVGGFMFRLWMARRRGGDALTGDATRIQEIH